MKNFELFEKLEAEKNEQQAAKMSAYMKDNFPFLGVPKPRVDEIIKPFIRQMAKSRTVDWNFIFFCWGKEYREAQYAGAEYIYAIQKKLTDHDVDNLKKLIITKPWWDISDGLDKVIGNLSLRYPSINNEMLAWSSSDNIWLRRVAIDYQQKLKDKTNTELLEKIIYNNLGTDEFFINKAIGWSLRDYSKVNPDWVKSFLTKYEQKLARLSIKEASKYVIKMEK
jgi:3-methyladenine DNA glycosylase AlkD